MLSVNFKVCVDKGVLYFVSYCIFRHIRRPSDKTRYKIRAKFYIFLYNNLYLLLYRLYKTTPILKGVFFYFKGRLICWNIQ